MFIIIRVSRTLFYNTIIDKRKYCKCILSYIPKPLVLSNSNALENRLHYTDTSKFIMLGKDSDFAYSGNFILQTKYPNIKTPE